MTTTARNNERQTLQYIAAKVSLGDTGLSAGTLEFPARLPKNASIVSVFLRTVTAFNATTTNVLTVGTVSGTANDIVTGGDHDEATTGATTLLKGVGVLSSTAEKQIFAKYTQSGAAASQGVVDIVVQYVDFSNK